MKQLTAVTAVAVLFFAGCEKGGPSATTQPGASGRVRVALMMKSRQNPFFARMAEGAEKAAKRLDVDLQILATDRETDTEKQTSQVETVVAGGVDVILMTPVDSKAIIAPLLQARQRGIQVINLDNRIDLETAQQAGLQLAAFIGPDNVEGARKSAAAMIEKIGGSGEVAMLEGVRGADNAEQRKRGFQKAVDAAGGKVKVVAMDTGEWMTEPAQKKMEAMLTSHPELKGVFAANDMMALGAIQAIKSAGKQGQIVVTAYDNLEVAQQAIREGSLYATVEQHPDRMGELGVESAVKLARGKKIPELIPVETDLITARELK